MQIKELYCILLLEDIINQDLILQLSALYDVKPPISKAKMNSLTRGAIKAIKFYKHVVQSVEKFIQKVSIQIFSWPYVYICVFYNLFYFVLVQAGVQSTRIVCNRFNCSTVPTSVWDGERCVRSTICKKYADYFS